MAAPVDELMAQARAGLRAAQELQSAYDEVGWRVADTEAQKLRHVVLHLARTVGKLASIAEQEDHRLDAGEVVDADAVARDLREVEGAIADLVSYAAQLAALAQTDLGVALHERLRGNGARWAPDSAFAALPPVRRDDDGRSAG